MVEGRMFHINVAIVQLLVLVLSMTVIHVILNNESNSIHESNIQENIESHDAMQEQSTNLHTGPIAEQHKNLTRELNVIYDTVNTILKADGGIEGHIDKESVHYNRSSMNSDKLDKALEVDENNTKVLEELNERQKKNAWKLDMLLNLTNSTN